jgi:hypothetical protein
MASLTFTLDTTAPTVAITSTGGSTTVATQLISGTVDVADAGVGQPDLFDVDVGLFDRGLNFRDVPAGVDHDSLFGGFAPDHRAVLLKQRHRNDDRTGLCLGFGFLGHVSTMPIFCALPRERLKGKIEAFSLR